MAGFFHFNKHRQAHQLRDLPLEKLTVSEDFQPSAHAAEIETIARRILHQGITQPLTVQKQQEQYRILIGERWYYAAKQAGLQEVPCILLEAGEKNGAVLHMVQQLQQQKLSFFEEASAIEQLITHYGMTQEDAAACLGKAQSTIANKLRLLRLTPKERDFILTNNLTERHARALLRLRAAEERWNVLQSVVEEQMNVEKTEAAVEHIIGTPKKRSGSRRRRRDMQGIRSFLTLMEKSIQQLNERGIAAQMTESREQEVVLIQVRIPIHQEQGKAEILQSYQGNAHQ